VVCVCCGAVCGAMAPGPEWALVRVEVREAKEPFYRLRFLPAGTPGYSHS